MAERGRITVFRRFGLLLSTRLQLTEKLPDTGRQYQPRRKVRDNARLCAQSAQWTTGQRRYPCKRSRGRNR